VEVSFNIVKSREDPGPFEELLRFPSKENET